MTSGVVMILVEALPHIFYESCFEAIDLEKKFFCCVTLNAGEFLNEALI